MGSGTGGNWGDAGRTHLFNSPGTAWNCVVPKLSLHRWRRLGQATPGLEPITQNLLTGVSYFHDDSLLWKAIFQPAKAPASAADKEE